jgi:ABC-type branched-subunit amino acid transport system permease subunit
VKKLLEIGAYIFIGAVLLNIIETIYFGCNMTPMSKAEEFWDVICWLLLNLGVTFMAVGFLMNKKDNE